MTPELLNIPKFELLASTLVTSGLVQLLTHPQARVTLNQPDALSQWADHLTEREDNNDQVMLLGNRFNKLSKLSESLVENGDNPSCVTLEGEEASNL